MDHQLYICMRGKKLVTHKDLNAGTLQIIPRPQITIMVGVDSPKHLQEKRNFFISRRFKNLRHKKVDMPVTSIFSNY